MNDSALLVEQARRYLGVRFAHQGRSKETGVDCLGLLVCVMRDVGLRLRQRDVEAHDRRDYRVFPDVHTLRFHLNQALDVADDMRVGDVVLFNVDGRPQHLALIADYPVAGRFGMIHSYAPMRKVIEHRLDEMWQSRIEQVYRVPN